MESFTAVMVTGPRAAGKTTTAARVAAQVVRLDQPAPAAAFRADPDAALRRTDRPVLLDEWQNVPEVLGAVKRAVDGGAPPGSFVLAGSVRADLEQEVWPLTGRAIRLRMYGLTEREINGIGDPSISALDNLTAGGDDVTLPATVPDLPGYIDLAVRGSFPETALHLQGGGDRQRWLDSYLAQLLSRDALAAGPGRDPVRLRRYFEALAASTAGAPADLTLYDAAGINARTATGYDGLLERLFVTESVPAYSHNRLTRLARGKKRYVLDTGLVGSALQVTADEVLGDPDLFGRILDTFATAQLRAELALAPRPHQLFHLRDKNGRREIDLLIDLGRKGVFGIEIKAAAAPSPPDAGHLCWLRDQLGRRFIGGAVLHTGPGVYELGERILAMPLCVLWS
jgi:uncharacterized protein